MTAADDQSGAASERKVTRWVDPQGRKPIKYSEWKAKWGPEEPLKAEKVYETAPQARGGPAAPVFYVLVRWGLWDSIAERGWRYVHDLEAEGYTVYTWLLTGGSAPGYRAWIIDKRAETGMDGLVLIGNFSPWHPWFEMDDDFDNTHSEFPCDLFFMDLDGTWTDADGDGMYDGHSGNVAPEIYVGRLSAETLTLGGSDEVTLINNYLDKDHKYRMHEYSLTHRALVYVDDDWVPWADSDNAAVGMAYGTRTFVKYEWTTTGADYKARLDDNYEWIHVEVHSSASAHTFKVPVNVWDGSVSNSEIRSIDPLAFFYNLFACSAARYVESNYIGGWYIFTNTYGLGAVGSTKTGSMLQFNYFYTPLGAKKTLGEAFKAWFTDALGPTHDLGERRWFYGMTLLGDPALRTVVPYFTRTISPGSATVQQGGSTTATVTVTSYDGYARTVTLTSADEPTGVTVAFTPASGTPTFSSTMTITVGSTAPVGTHSIKVTVTGAEGQKIDGWFMLTVTAGPPWMTVKNDKRYPDPYVPKDTMTTSIRIVNPGAATKVNFAWLLYVGTYVPILATPLSLPASSDNTYPIPIPVGEWSATTFDAAWVVALLKPSDNSIISYDYALWRYAPAPGTEPTTTPEDFAAQVVEAAKDAASNTFPT